MNLLIRELKLKIDPDILFSRLGIRTSGIFLQYHWRNHRYYLFSPFPLKKLTGSANSINYKSSHMEFRYYADLPTFLYEEYKKIASDFADRSFEFVPAFFGIVNDQYLTATKNETFWFYFPDPYLLYDPVSDKFFIISIADKEGIYKNQLAEDLARYIRKIITSETMFLQPNFNAVPLIIFPEKINLAAIYDKLKHLYKGRNFPLFMNFTFNMWIHPWRMFYELSKLYSVDSAYYIAEDGIVRMGFSWEKIMIEPPNPSANLEAIIDFELKESKDIKVINKINETGNFKERASYVLKARKIHTLLITNYQEKYDLFFNGKLVKGVFKPDKIVESQIGTLLLPTFYPVGEVYSSESMKKSVTYNVAAGREKWHIFSIIGNEGKIINGSTQLSLTINRSKANYSTRTLTRGDDFEEVWRNLIGQGKQLFHSIFGRRKLYGIFTPAGEEIKILK